MNNRIASPRIALIHAVPVAVEPIGNAFARMWPEAETVNILDDSLSADRARDGKLTDRMCERIATLGSYAMENGADAILYTCSAFGPAIEAVAEQLPIPVLKPNEAMFSSALEAGSRIGMLATFGPSVGSMEAEFESECRQSAKVVSLHTVLVEDAMTALRAGDVETHNRLLAERAGELADCDAIMLAHFSTSRAKDAVAAQVACPVLTSPDASVAALRTSATVNQ